jgi:hypothetical protein
MPVFICRWPNGDVSAASADDLDEAIELLDEIGNARGNTDNIFEAAHFMVHFKLSEKAVDWPENDTPLWLEGFGEKFWSQLMEYAYPEYYKEILDDDVTAESVNESLQRERKRLA